MRCNHGVTPFEPSSWFIKRPVVDVSATQPEQTRQFGLGPAAKFSAHIPTVRSQLASMWSSMSPRRLQVVPSTCDNRTFRNRVQPVGTSLRPMDCGSRRGPRICHIDHTYGGTKSRRRDPPSPTRGASVTGSISPQLPLTHGGVGRVQLRTMRCDGRRACPPCLHTRLGRHRIKYNADTLQRHGHTPSPNWKFLSIQPDLRVFPTWSRWRV